MKKEQFYTVKEAAEKLNTSGNQIYLLLWGKKLTRYKQGRRTLVLKKEIEDRLKIIKAD